VRAEFWHNAWESGKTGWRQRRVNTRLIKFWPEVTTQRFPTNDDQPANEGSAGISGEQGTVFVPLCGDSPDMLWLLQQGYRVVGCELNESAIESFFERFQHDFEDGSRLAVECGDKFTVYRCGRIAVYCGDFFSLEPEHLNGVDSVYDRAALVAMNEELRPAYARQMGKLITAGSNYLLITFTYDQSKMDGPPFSVTDDEVQLHYGDQFDIKQLGGESGPEILGNLKDRGLDSVAETVYHLQRREH